ncbi:MAG: extracellular solute-binding protein [Rubrivivax sp.]|nr:extracellular solute-binding protein [Rubrivivax sp.]
MEKKMKKGKRVSRRSFLKGAAVSVVLTGIGIGGWSGRVRSAETINVMMNGGDYEKLARKLAVAPFEKKYGATVNITPGSGAQMLTRLRAEKQNPSQDVVIIDSGPAAIGIAEGLFEKLNPANIPNLKDMEVMSLDKNGYGPIVHSHSVGLAYNERLLKKPVPKSWKDLWGSVYKDTLLLVNITLTPGYLFLLQINMMNGGTYENIDPGIEMIKKLKPNIRRFAQNIAEIRSTLQNEDIITVCGPNIPLEEAKKANQPIKPIFPIEGNVLSPATGQVVRGTKKKELAEKFINEYLSPESQMGWAVEYNIAEFNKKVKLPKEVAQRLPSNNILYDFDKISKNLEKWIEKFSREIKI